MMRLLIADDHPVFLESLPLLVAKIPGYAVVGKMSNGREVLEFLARGPVDMVLTDIQMPGMGGIELIGELRRLYPAVKVLMLTMLEDTETVRAALKAGAAGYVLKSASLAVFSKALNTVAAGGTYYSEELLQRLEERKEGGPDGLTDREVEIVRLISAGLKSSEIAKRLFISVNTVDTHRKNIFSKTGVKNAVGLTHYARKHGIV
ncbi:MAG TPA: response regulator transcription factor [Puia sp.]|jgi:DNA-binding NarL/FixJ family response regulator|nr:response regulator transcription factor [Puia sp.]